MEVDPLTAGTALAAAAAIGYLIGSVPFGYLLARTQGVDLMAHGSRSTGATNALRTLGPTAGLITLICDAGKAVVAILIARGLLAGCAQPWPSYGAAAAALAVIIGHSWSVFLRFRGGKSVAAGAGSLLMLKPGLLLWGMAVFVGTVAVTRYVSLGSLLAALTVLIAALVAPLPLELRIFVVATAVIIIARHRANIQRLLAGTENRLSVRARR